ncbi:MAG TPA: radical SAM protein [Candidatus Omnitrophota bacterium]|nr:radical SAM protein [Candidatus Omnitrophota bacterium]HPD84920.1 radical SAM protein [Candidatus Omnitrophota bacterium]HRZ03778.1 radical SAM protein [Candidatus Omnitrophota bacterium]
MAKNNFEYLYGPVYSWRLGYSLGIDPISTAQKVCNFNCVYCQLGPTRKLIRIRKIFVPTQEIIKEIKALPKVRIDYLTFSGNGEPTLAKNLGEMIKGIRKIRKEKIAVITNSALIYRRDVQKDLALADFVLAKIDAYAEEDFRKINRPVRGTQLKTILEGIADFKSNYNGKLALQIMFVEENKKYAGEIARLVREINPDEVQLNTALRPCGVKPLPKKELESLKIYFSRLPVISVYDVKENLDFPQKEEVVPFNERDTIRRHGDFRKKASA